MVQTTNTQTTNTETSTSGNGKGEAKAKVLTAVDAITKISKILDQLSAVDRKRVLAFVNASEGNE